MIWINIAIILFFVFKWVVMNWVTIFHFFSVYVLVATIWGAACLWSLVYGIRQYKRLKREALMPLLTPS